MKLIEILEKNRLESGAVWVFLLQIDIPGASPIYLAGNNENVVWNGETWTAFPFDISDITEDDKEIPSITLRVSNLSGAIMDYLETNDGGAGVTATLRVVNTDHLDNLTPFFEEELAVKAIPYDDYWIEFKLGADFVANQRTPLDRYMKDFCHYPGTTRYCGVECGLPVSIKATYSTCNGSLVQCRERGNSPRFGGFPGLPGGLYVG
jgi:phage-related protein